MGLDHYGPAEAEGWISNAELLLKEFAGLNRADPQEKDTPRRFLEALLELTTPKPFSFTTFKTDVRDMVVEKNIQFATLCRHHVLPFMGVCHIAYVPDGRIAGLSKLPRLVDHCSRRLSTQEELTAMIANLLYDPVGHLIPLGVGVVMEAQHTCMAIRGAKAQNVITRTAAMRGVFADHTKTAKAEFLEAIR